MNKLKLSRLCAAVDTYYKTAQKVPQDMAAAENLTNSRIQSINSVNPKQMSFEEFKKQVNDIATSTTQASAWLDYRANLITQEQFQKVLQAADAKIKSATPVEVSSPHNLPAAKPTSTKPHPTLNYEGPIDPKIQQILVYNFKKNLGKSGPNGDGVDGKLGSLTRKAINEAKASSNLSSHLNDKDFFEYLMTNFYAHTKLPQKEKPSTPTEAIPVGGRVPRGRTGIV